MTTTRRPCTNVRRLATGAMLALTGLAIRQELVKPTDERDWHGVLFGWLPYDFRPPTVQRFRDTFWAPANGHVFVPRMFGIGWDINLGRVFTLLGWRHDYVDRP